MVLNYIPVGCPCFLFGILLIKGAVTWVHCDLNVLFLTGSDGCLSSRLSLPVRSPSPRKRPHLKFPNMRGTTSRYFVTSLAVSRPKRLAPFAKKLVRSACSKSNVFGGARISSLPTNGEIRRASLKTPVWEANFFPAPASLLHSPF